MEFFCVKLSAIYLLKNCVYYMLKLKCKQVDFMTSICSIYLYKLLKLKWSKKEKLKDSVSRDYCYLCVNIIRSYICLGSNHQLRSRGPTMFAINVQFGMIQRLLFQGYIQTTELGIQLQRDGPGNYLGGWGLSVEKGKCALQIQ